MNRCRGTATPEQLEHGIECRALAALLMPAPRLRGEPFRFAVAPALQLQVMGQLSERFVMQHFHPSFP